MRNNILALFLSLGIHALILAFFLISFASDLFIPPPTGSEEGKKINLKNFNFKTNTTQQPQKQSVASNAQQEQPKQQEQKPQKPTPKKQEIKKQEVKQTKPKKQKKQERPTKTPQKQVKKQQPIKPQKAKQVESKAPSIESTPSTPSRTAPSIYDFKETKPSPMIQDLYGREFGSLSRTQRDFIKSNLDSIGKITQSHLKYPQLAGRIGQEGENVIEFYLHPNGDISGLRLITPSGYALLDDNTLYTVRIAYKDYPRPKEKTKIRIRVLYQIF